MNKLFKGVFLTLSLIANTTYSSEKDRTPEIALGSLAGLKALYSLGSFFCENPGFTGRNKLRAAQILTIASLAGSAYSLSNNNNKAAAACGLIAAISANAEDRIILPKGETYPDYEESLSFVIHKAAVMTGVLAAIYAVGKYTADKYK